MQAVKGGNGCFRSRGGMGVGLPRGGHEASREQQIWRRDANRSNSGSMARPHKQEPHLATRVESVAAPPSAAVDLAAPKKMTLKKSCDFCVKRKRHCDGLGVKRCSFCIANNQPECHYSTRLPKTCKKKSGLVAADDTEADQVPLPRLVVSDSTSSSAHDDELEQREQREQRGQREQREKRPETFATGTGLAAADFPLKRCRLSVSPATGLIGLQENDYLGDYFGCLGFLPLASERIVRHAMVNIMLSAVPQHRTKSHRTQGLGRREAIKADVWPPCRGDGGPREGGCGGRIGSRTPPAASSTCILWCAIALGALVQGCPLEHVASYVKLAQESLGMCLDSITVDTARAYLAMAVLHNFLGDQAQNRECVRCASSMFETVLPEELPSGLQDMLRFAEKAWVFEAGVAPAEVDGYWKDAAPVPKYSNRFHQVDVCSTILVVEVRCNQAFFQDHVADGSPFGFEAHEPVSAAVAAVAGMAEESSGGFCVPLKSLDGDGALPGQKPGPATTRLREEALPELLALSEAVERSETRLGVGGLLFYCNLWYMQFLDDNPEEASKSLKRSAAVLLRYPGLCRYKIWLHIAHLLLWSLATGGCRELYEKLRAVLNPMQPSGSPQAPPFEEWRSMSDICDHVFCSGLQARLSATPAGAYPSRPFSADGYVDSFASSSCSDSQEEPLQETPRRPPPQALPLPSALPATPIAFSQVPVRAAHAAIEHARVWEGAGELVSGHTGPFWRDDRLGLSSTSSSSTGGDHDAVPWVVSDPEIRADGCGQGRPADVAGGGCGGDGVDERGAPWADCDVAVCASNRSAETLPTSAPTEAPPGGPPLWNFAAAAGCGPGGVRRGPTGMSLPAPRPAATEVREVDVGFREGFRQREPGNVAREGDHQLTELEELLLSDSAHG